MAEYSALATDLLANKSSPTQSNVLSNQPKPSVETSQSETVLEVTFSVIASLAFVLNFMFCVVLLKKPSLMRKPHNFLLFNLAITDLLTGEISFLLSLGRVII